LELLDVVDVIERPTLPGQSAKLNGSRFDRRMIRLAVITAALAAVALAVGALRLLGV
jgi:hypothetical protein